jgi:pimeloyl-ACP methyl ester carboxylesterase
VLAPKPVKALREIKQAFDRHIEPRKASPDAHHTRPTGMKLRLIGLALVTSALSSPGAGAVGASTASSGMLPATLCPSAESPVKEAGFVSAVGIDHWVTVRGASCANPVILIVHGGPGNPMSPYSEAVFRSWERDFTVAQWDQRGAGRTFARNPASTKERLSIELMTQDGVAIANDLAARFGKRKIILVGTSWGSVLGVHMAQSRPGLFSAYVGMSQLVSYADNQQASYQKLLAAARAAEDVATVAAVEALGPPPWTNPRNYGIVRRAIRKYEKQSTDAAPSDWWVPAPAYATSAELANYEAGEEYSFIQFVGLAGDGMLSQVDLPSLGGSFQMPVFIVQGSEDLLTVPEVARRYFDSIKAPAKEFALVPRSGHDPNAAMMDAARNMLDRSRRTEPSTAK